MRINKITIGLVALITITVANAIAYGAYTGQLVEVWSALIIVSMAASLMALILWSAWKITEWDNQ